jgi:hypothetical protein
MSVPLQAIQISWASPDADEEKTTRMPSDENDWTVSPQSESKRPDTTLMRRTCHACAIALRSLEVLTMLTCTASSPDAHLSPGLPRRSVKTRHMSRQCASSTSAPDGTVRTASSRTSCVIRQDSPCLPTSGCSCCGGAPRQLRPCVQFGGFAEVAQHLYYVPCNEGAVQASTVTEPSLRAVAE